MKVKDLNHVSIHVEDVAASCAFYGDALELCPKSRPDFDFEGAWFALGPTRELHIIGGREQSVQSDPRGTHFAIEVDSIAQTARFLTEKAVDFIGPRERPDGAKQIFVVDPDGHYVELTELT